MTDKQVIDLEDGYRIVIEVDESDEKTLYLKGPVAALEAVAYAFNHFEMPKEAE